MIHRRLRLALVLMLALMVSSATGLSAGPIIVKPPQVTTQYGIRDSITGADMTGMTVSMVYGYRFCEVSECPPELGPFTITMTWEATGPTSGAAAAWWGPPESRFPVVSLSLDGDTSEDLAWFYDSIVLTPLMSIELDGRFAGVYFDRASPNPGTPGSGPGSDFSFGESPPLCIYGVTYANPVAIQGNPPQNDLYALMRIDFWEWPYGPEDFRFTQDTDHGVVPEPASGLLVCGGLVGLRAWRKRRQ